MIVSGCVLIFFHYLHNTLLSSAFFSLPAVLEINFVEFDYSLLEGSETLSSQISFAFHITLTPVSVDEAESRGLGNFINSMSIGPLFRATAGVLAFLKLLFYPYSLNLLIRSDFAEQSLTIQIPANRWSYDVRDFLSIVNDNVDEDEQSFAVVAEIGRDISDEISCFQTLVGQAECFGRQGATQIRIVDNDRKYLIIK